MTKHNAPAFAVPANIDPNLARVRSYWEGLRRGDNKVPFGDDVKLSSLGELADDAVLLDAFDDPLRFRFAIVGKHIERKYGRSITGKFLDEVEGSTPFDELGAQCRTAVAGQEPTYYRNSGAAAAEYCRLALPLWGEGRVSMLLVAVSGG
jgi:hypothetical protein